MKDRILEKVGAFPPLDDTINKIIAVCNDPNGSIMQLTKIVENDPMTTANILKAANSPLYGFSKEIKSVAQAVSIFGMETVKGFAFSSFLQKKPNLDLTPYAIETKDFPKITQSQNAFVLKWYKGNKNFLDILSLSSFLMEVGKIVLSDIVIEHNKTKEFKEAILKCKNLKELQEFEEKVFGLTNEEIAALILEDWNFNPKIVDSIKYLNNPHLADKEIKAYAASLQAVKSIITTNPFDKEESLKEALNIVEKYSLDREKFLKVYEIHFELESVSV